MRKSFFRSPLGFTLQGGVLVMSFYEAKHAESRGESLYWGFMGGFIAALLVIELLLMFYHKDELEQPKRGLESEGVV